MLIFLRSLSSLSLTQQLISFKKVNALERLIFIRLNCYKKRLKIFTEFFVR